MMFWSSVLYFLKICWEGVYGTKRTNSKLTFKITIIVSIMIHYDWGQKAFAFIRKMAFLDFVIWDDACMGVYDRIDNTLPVSENFARSLNSEVIFIKPVRFEVEKPMGVFFPGVDIEVETELERNLHWIFRCDRTHR